MKHKKWHLLFILFILNLILVGQEYTITSFSKSGGLPSDYCYNIEQDDEGFMWISTQAALCTFDGLQFQTDLLPELANKQIFNVYKDSKGRIWFSELSGELYYLENGNITLLDHLDNISKNKVLEICDDNQGHIWITQQIDKLAYCLDVDNLSIVNVACNQAEQLSLLKEMNVFPNPSQVAINADTLLYVQDDQTYEFTNFSIFNFFTSQIMYDDNTSIFTYEDQLFYHDFKDGRIHRILTKFQEQIDLGVRNIALDKNKNLWMATKNGIYRFTDPLSDSCALTTYLAGVNGGSVKIDNQDNIWLTTLDEGLHKLTQTFVETIHDKSARNITSIILRPEYIIYGTDKGEVVMLDLLSQKEVYRKNLNNKSTYIYDLTQFDDNNILITSIKQINKLNINNLKITTIWSNGYFKNTKTFEDRVWIAGGDKSFTGFLNQQILDVIPPYIRSYSNFPISKNEAYIGTIKGLYKLALHKNTHHKILPHIITNDIKVITQGPDSTMWLGTHGNGIYILENDTLKHHLLELPSMHIHDIIKDKDDMWVATSNGLCRVRSNNETYSSKTLNTSDGLPSDEINKIYLFKEKIYAATTNGIAKFNTDIEFNDETPIIKINSIRINERDTLIQKDYKLDDHQRNIKISFSGILYNQLGSIIYKYRMVGVDSDWITTTQNDAQYPTLQAGNYEFLISAKSINSKWSTHKKVEFSIPQRLTEYTLYKILLLLMAACVSLLSLSFFYKGQERNRLFKLSQMTALRAQMNPHFVFNSLNSVQDYILRDDKRSANKYISNFSKLMRYILNASDKEYTRLVDELNALELYISIESMRFDNTLEYNFEIDPSIDPNIYEIPTMILQPYLENAINHGLKPAVGKKILSIKVYKYMAGLLIEIYDNGVGRKQSRKTKLLNKNSYVSKSTTINQKRMVLLNKINQKQNKVTFKDIYDEAGNPTGTKVEILLQTIKLS